MIILGVGRSGTTLLRVMLDRNSELAVPYESFFVLPLARRHPARIVLNSFCNDLCRLPVLGRNQMAREDALAFERVAGDVLRSAGYELLEPSGRYPSARGRLELARFEALSRSWNAAGATYQRSPLWRRSHPPRGR